MTACTQPGCTGRIVDGYCDVCGSPAGAAPFVGSSFGGVTRPCRGAWPNGSASGAGIFPEAEEQQSHHGLYAAKVYRNDSRRLLRRLR